MDRSFVIQGFLRLLSLLPLRLNHSLGVLLGYLVYRLSSDFRRIAQINIGLCFPEQMEEQRQGLLKDSLMETGKGVTEVGALWFWRPDKVYDLVREVSGQEFLEQAMARGKGVILAAPHLGCWEVVGVYCGRRWPMTNLYRPQRSKGMDILIRRARERTGTNVVPTDASGVRALFKALANGELVGILPDQDPGREAGVFAPFFAVQANTMSLLPRLASKSGATVLFTYAERLPKGQGYHVYFIPAPDGLIETDPVKAATSMNQGVEDCVRKLPAQYQWAYKRFKTRPESEKDFY